MRVYKYGFRDGEKVITIRGSNRPLCIFYAKPSWSEEDEPYFMFRKRRYYLSEFMRFDNSCPEYMKEFDGYMSDSYFSGVFVKIIDSDFVKAYYYYS